MVGDEKGCPDSRDGLADTLLDGGGLKLSGSITSSVMSLEKRKRTTRLGQRNVTGTRERKYVRMTVSYTCREGLCRDEALEGVRLAVSVPERRGLREDDGEVLANGEAVD